MNYLKPYKASIYMILIAIGFIGFLPSLPIAVKAILYVFGALTVIINKKTQNLSYFLFLLYLVLNLIICSPASFFKTWERLLLFAPLFATVTAAFQSDKIVRFRAQALKILLSICILLSFFSFFCFFLGINYFQTDLDNSDYISNVGWFAGLYNHSMVLGPMSGISACASMYLFLTKREKMYLICAIICAGSVMLAASRTAFVAMIISMIFLLYKYSAKKRTFVKYLVSSIFILTVTFPLWSGSLSRMAAKQVIFEEQGRFGTRTNKWENRIAEFSSSPLIGIGFSSVGENSGDLDKNSGGVEPGSSWLAVLSMTGIIGFLFVFSFFFKAYRINLNSLQRDAPLLMSLLAFISIHMMGEGYIYAAGNPTCVIAWLIVGCNTDLKYRKNEIGIF
ncbi:MAG: O-antigen ligase family protein [Alphaproteobacteria bacterium]|nr:O-antigen ligase family protein [Alphaproteobacteria bacterium]